MLYKVGPLALAALLFASAAHAAEERHPEERRHMAFSLGVAGVATPQPNVLSVAAPLANLTDREVTDVKIERIELSNAPLQTSLPLTVGTIGARATAIVQAQFDSRSLTSGHSYELVIRGAYRRPDRYDEKEDAVAPRRGRDDEDDGYEGRDHEGKRRFKVHTVVVMPPPSEGSGQLGSVQVPSQKVQGGKYPPQPPREDKDVNLGAPPVPTNPDAPGAPTPQGTDIKPAPK